MFGRVIAGASIFVGAIVALSILCLGAVDAESLPYLVGVELLCLCGVGLGLILSAVD